MRRFLSALFVFVVGFTTIQAQGISCPAVVASPDTTLCGGCVFLEATPVSGFTTTDYTTQQIPYNPYPYNAGTPILLNIDDTWSSVLPIGFDFCFYGNSYNQLVIGSNGLVTFDLTTAGGYCQWPINDPIPSVNNPMNSIMGPFHDIDPSITGVIRWALYGTAPCRTFVVSFDNVAMFSCTSLFATQQIVLYETTNVIETYIQNRPSCSWNSDAAIHGIHNATGTQAVVVPGRNYPTVWTTSNDAWSFVPNGVQNYSVTWFENGVPFSNNDTVTVCPSGNTDYVAQATYTNCNGNTVVVTDTATIGFSPGSFTVGVSSTDINCNGGTDGTATATVTGGQAPITYVWNSVPAQTTATAIFLAPGTYQVVVTDGSGCSVVEQVTINEPPLLNPQISGTDLDCNGDADGTAIVAVFGGTGPFTYSWSSGGNTTTETGLSGGLYMVTVTDANGCVQVPSIIINEPSPLTLNLVATDITCNGDADGTVTATFGGGTSPYGFNWNPWSPSPVQFNLVAGNYAITITDGHGCTIDSTVTVNDPAPLVVNVTGSNVVCNGAGDGTATANVTGAQGALSYAWNTVPSQTTQSINGLAPGTYSVVVTDANGCSGTDQVTLTEPSPMSLQTSFTDVNCNGSANGTATVGAVGGGIPYSYAWSSGGTAATETGLSGGSYTVTVTDNNLCAQTASVTIFEPSLLELDMVGTDVNCNGGANGTVTTTVVGGTSPYSYQWNPAAAGTNLFNLGAGTYDLTVTDGNGCMVDSSVTIIDPAPLAVSITGDDDLCWGESTTLISSVTGGTAPYQYQWVSVPNSVNNTTDEVTHIPGGDSDYFLTVVDANGCQLVETFLVAVHPNPVIDFSPSDRQGCDTLQVTFTNNTTDASSYVWNLGDGTVVNSFEPIHNYTTGWFTVELTATNQWGCTDHQQQLQIIQVLPTPIASFETRPDLTEEPICLSEATMTFTSTSLYDNEVHWDMGNGDSLIGGEIDYIYTEPGDFNIVMTAFNQFGCFDIIDSLIHILPDPYLYIPSGFTPNDDGLNDEFLVVGTEIVDYNMMIFDRFGKLIFETNSLSESWNGKFGDLAAQEGAYVWRVIARVNKGYEIKRQGTVTLIR